MRPLASLAVVFMAVGACGTTAKSVSVTESLAEAVSSAPPGSVIQLEGARYHGPIVIDRPLTLRGVDGTVIDGPSGETVIRITAADVAVEGLAVEGGSTGIEVVGAEDVSIDDVAISGAEWHGILISDSHVTVTDCQVSGLTGDLAQGVEIRNSDSKPASTIQGCVIDGPVFEGLVAHVSEVEFIDNRVSGSTERGIVITEMSAGRMQGNSVESGRGSAYFCGDMSRCSIVDNAAIGVASSSDDYRSAGGHGLVVHFHSEAFVEGFDAVGLDGDEVLVMLDSALAPSSVFP